VSEEVINSYFGPKHCDTQTVVFLVAGWPLGTSTSEVTRQRQYVRDVGHKLPPEVLPHTLDLDAQRPASARFSGFHTEKMELWLSPDDQDRAAYIVMEGVVERWPRATKPIYCG